MGIRSAYYFIKPFIPRAMQIRLRSKFILSKRSLFRGVWPIDEKAGCPPKEWPGWPEEKRFAFVLARDVETEKGQDKCLPLISIEEKLGFRSSVNFVPEDYNVSFELRDYLTRNGFEVGIHGLTHHGNLFKSKKVFEKNGQ